MNFEFLQKLKKGRQKFPKNRLRLNEIRGLKECHALVGFNHEIKNQKS